VKSKIKLFVSDIDGTLTDGTVYYSEKGEELKQFSHRDGRGFHLLHHDFNIKCALITSENKGINKTRFEKFNRLGTVQYYADNVYGKGKLEKLFTICKKAFDLHYDFDIEMFIKNHVAFIGDDTNDLDVLNIVKYKACPSDTNYLVKKVKGIKVMKNKGGYGAVREFIDWLIKKDLIYKET
jgi:N-acylneuraminate cytidylyltransferase